MITYNSTTGLLTAPGVSATAYSGYNGGLNNPDYEADVGLGPIPRGKWEITAWFTAGYENKGPMVARLAPVGHDAHGRSGFLIHGDNQEMNHSASHGCIILDHADRVKLHDNGGTELEVV